MFVLSGDTLIAGPKGYAALGAFNAGERTQAFDMLGFQRQLVFASFSELIAFRAERAVDDRYAVARAHNRALANFCSQDRRLCGVGLLPLDVTTLSLAELDRLLSLGLEGGLGSPPYLRRPFARPYRSRSSIWARLAEAGVPFVIHVGGRAAEPCPA